MTCASVCPTREGHARAPRLSLANLLPSHAALPRRWILAPGMEGAWGGGCPPTSHALAALPSFLPVELVPRLPGTEGKPGACLRRGGAVWHRLTGDTVTPAVICMFLQGFECMGAPPPRSSGGAGGNIPVCREGEVPLSRAVPQAVGHPAPFACVASRPHRPCWGPKCFHTLGLPVAWGERWHSVSVCRARPWAQSLAMQSGTHPTPPRLCLAASGCSPHDGVVSCVCCGGRLPAQPWVWGIW